MMKTLYSCILLLFVISTFYAGTTVNAQRTIKTISPCLAQFSDGTKIDLTSLADNHKFRWRKKGSNPPGDTHWYYYNPCKPFYVSEDCPRNAVCLASSDEKSFTDLGRQDNTVKFVYEDQQDVFGMVYTSADQQQITTVVCYCSKNKETNLQVVGEVSRDSWVAKSLQLDVKITTLYLMNLNSTCCCPDGCVGKNLSPGSILLIIFASCLFFYLLVGVVFNYSRSKSVNYELLPNIEFWREQVNNIKGGFLFLFGGCIPKKDKDGYSNI